MILCVTLGMSLASLGLSCSIYTRSWQNYDPGAKSSSSIFAWPRAVNECYISKWLKRKECHFVTHKKWCEIRISAHVTRFCCNTVMCICFHISWSCLHSTKAEPMSCDRPNDLQSLKELLSGLLQEKYTDTLSAEGVSWINNLQALSCPDI